MNETCKIIDTTLREGEQTPGIRFTTEEKKRIIDGLVRVGVTEVELGIASPRIKGIAPLIEYCRSTYPELQISLWARCRDEDICHAAELRPDILSLSIPISDIHLEKKLGKNRDWAQNAVQRGIAASLNLGMRVSVGFEDATRADEAFLKKMALLVVEAGSSRIRLADTVGISTPGSISQIISTLRRGVPTCDLAIHAHNDFGMAMANALSALEAGAVWADASILGLGERTGCTRLEELVGFLSLAAGYTNLCAEQLRGLSHYVSGITKIKIEKQRPIIGGEIFTCETGLHLQGLHVDPRTYEPFAPERVGAVRKLLYGLKSGKKALSQMRGDEGQSELQLNPREANMETLSSTLSRLKRPLNGYELVCHWEAQC